MDFNKTKSIGDTPSVTSWAVSQVAAGLQVLNGNRLSDGFGILMYHRVTNRVAGFAPPTWNVTPDRLKCQLSGLLRHGFECWPLSRLVRAWHESKPIPAHVFAVTFDDGYANNFSQALPILRELNVPATVFLATKYLDTRRPFPFEDWPSFEASRLPPEAWRPLSTDECKEMLDSGLIELGAHTHSHERFLDRPEEFRKDLNCCLDILRERFEIEPATFAFPFGDHDEELIDVVKQLGVTCSLLTLQRRVLPTDDPFRWGRFHVQPNNTAAMLAAKLSGWHTAVVTAGRTLTQPLTTVARGVRGVSL